MKMKRLYIIFISMLVMLGFTFAADFAVNTTPTTQPAISGSVINLSVVANNNTGFNSYFIQSFPSHIKYVNSNIVPINNPALALGVETTPRWLLSAGQTLNLTIQAKVVSQTFPTLSLVSSAVDTSNLANVYTSAIANIEPISDVAVTKTLISAEPKFTGDTVTYNIEIKNIGSAIATGISLVDVRPNNIVTFLNQGFVNGVSQVPTIYNGLPNNYLFNINELVPGASANLQITGTMSAMHTAGQSFTNQAFVLTESAQYSTTNDNDSVVNNVRGVPNVYVNVSQISTGPAVAGNLITYMISYGNNGTDSATGIVLQNILPADFSFVSASVVPTSQSANIASRTLGSLSVGQNGQIILTGSFDGGLSAGDVFVNTGTILTIDTELNYTDNSSSVTGSVISLQNLGVQIYANNLTDASRNTNTGINILAISGDIVQLEIVIINTGNVALTGNISLSNITGFVGYAGFTSWNAFVVPGTSQTITLTGLAGPKNYVGFSPRGNLSYGTVSVFDTVLIEEPLVCGDGLITQNELCDTNGQIGTFLPGQHCEERNGQCTLVTEDITNTVCMNYVTSAGTGEQCMTVTVDYQQTEVTDALCDSITSPSNTIVVGSNNQGSMNFTCSSQNNVVANQIRIDCGNGNTGTANGVSSFTHSCNYVYNPNLGITENTYNVRCYVDNHTRNECASSIRLNEGYYGLCGDGQLDAGEDCDLGSNIADRVRILNYLDFNQNVLAGIYGNGNYYCQNCRIRQDETNQFAYQPPQCLGTNTTISLMKDELMPFWWRLWDRQEQMVSSNYNCNTITSNETKTIINKDSMKCTFAVYDGNKHQQLNDNPVNVFVTDCYEKDNSIMFKYFEDAYKINFDKVSGKYVYDTNKMFNGNVDTYGEYKLVLEKIEYNYCNPETKNWESGRTYQGICEVNFALTRPYIMQISTFGVDPIASSISDFLKDFYDMKGNALIDSTDINDTIDVTSASYGVDSEIVAQMDSFKKKYEPLSIAVDNKFKVRGNRTIGDLFNNGIVKKVPNQLIFFVKGNGQLTLKQLTEFFPGTPFTMYIEGMDVLVEGSVTTNGMIITDGKISFEDDSSKSYCEDGGQVVNGIFVAKGGFASVSKTRNTDKNQKRCPWGNLRVKGVLIGDGVENLVNNRRSHLNTWFNSSSNSESSLKKERKNKIFEGAALLIEYNPDLWTKLPPGAESFTKTLDVYRK